jgi:hypothetical protein
MRAIFLLLALLIAAPALAQPARTDQGNCDAAFAASCNVSVTASSGDVVFVLGWSGSGSGDPTFSTCGAINSGDWITRYLSGGISIVYARAPSALTGCTLTVGRSGATGIIAAYGAWSGVATAIFDSNVPTILSNTGGGSKPAGSSITTAQANNIILTWQMNAGDTAVDCSVDVGGTGSWSSVTTKNDINVGGLTVSQLSTTATQSFAPAATGGCANKASWQVLTDSITADTPSTGRSRLIQ